MITGFQLDATAKPIPPDFRIILTLISSDEEPYSFAIQKGKVVENYRHNPSPPEPNPSDEIWVESTPASTHHRFIIHTPEEQKILLGNFPVRISFEISIERRVSNEWISTNKVLIILNKKNYKIFQAREFIESEQEIEPVALVEPIVESSKLEKPDESSFNTNDVEFGDKVVQEKDSVQPSELEQPAGNLIQSSFEPLTNNEPNLVPTYESADQHNKPIKRRKRLTRLVKSVALFGIFSFALFSFTPLSLIPLDQPENEKFNVAITLPVAQPTIGDVVVASLVDLNGDSYNYIGSIENKSKNTYLLSNSENFVQVDENQIKGRVVISIPFLGIPF